MSKLAPTALALRPSHAFLVHRSSGNASAGYCGLLQAQTCWDGELRALRRSFRQLTLSNFSQSNFDFARAATTFLQSSIRGTCKALNYPGHVPGSGSLTLRAFALTTPAEPMILNVPPALRSSSPASHFSELDSLLAHQVYVYILVDHAALLCASQQALKTSKAPEVEWARNSVRSFEEHSKRASAHIGSGPLAMAVQMVQMMMMTAKSMVC